MREAAADERFEEAARYRNRLFSIRHLADRQAADKRAVGTADVIGLAIDGDQAAVQVFPLRDGKMIDRYGFHLENVAGADAQSILEAFVVEYYGAAPSVPPEVLVPEGVEDTTALEEYLCERRGGARRRAHAAPRGEAAARRARDRECAARARVRRGDSRGRPLAADRRARGAPRGAEPREPPRPHRVLRRLEHPGRVDRRVDDGLRRRAAEERRTTARSRSAGSTVRTTWGRCARPSPGGSRGLHAGDLDESFSRMPNLVVVDGGKGQLAAALCRARRVRPPARRGDLAREARGGGLRARAFRCRSSSTARARGSSSSSASATRRTASPCASTASAAAPARWRRSSRRCPGVGPVRRRAIIRHFGSVERFLAASQEELEGVPGLPQKTARDLYAQLHKAGPS